MSRSNSWLFLVASLASMISRSCTVFVPDYPLSPKVIIFFDKIKTIDLPKWYVLPIREHCLRIPRRLIIGDNPHQFSSWWCRQILDRCQPWRCQLRQKLRLQPCLQSQHFLRKKKAENRQFCSYNFTCLPWWYESEKPSGLFPHTQQRTGSTHWLRPSK